MEVIQVVISNKKYLELTNKLNDYILNNNIIKVKESSYEDSYFDTYLQKLKKINMEFILRKNEKEYNLLLFKIDSIKNVQTLVFSKKIVKTIENNLLKEEVFKILNDNILKIESDYSKIQYSNILKLDTHYMSYEFNSKKYGTYEIRLNKINYDNLNTLEYELEVKSYNNINDELEEVVKELLDYTDQEFDKISKKTRLKRYFKKKQIENEETKKRKETNINFSGYNISDFIVVVEGKSDERALRKIYKDLNIYLTHGLGLTDNRIYELKEMAIKNRKKILILTDPDVPGETIRKRILNIIPDAYNKYIYKDSEKNLKNKKQIGVESLAESEIKKIFKDLKKNSIVKGNYKMEDLINLGIYANKEKRAEFCKKYNISYGNNKKVLKQLNDYNIKI